MRVGDVMKDGSIVVSISDSGYAQLCIIGQVVIRKSRLRRALRLGWHQMPVPEGAELERNTVLVSRSVAPHE